MWVIRNIAGVVLVFLRRDASVVTVVVVVGFIAAHRRGNPRQLPKVRLGRGAGSCANPGSLYLGALDLRRQTNLASEKVFVIVGILVSASRKSLESVQVKLTCNIEYIQ